jgi:hypothetical protein
MTALLSLSLALLAPQSAHLPWKQCSSSIIDGWMEYRASGVRISFPANWNPIPRSQRVTASLAVLPSRLFRNPVVAKGVKSGMKNWPFVIMDNGLVTTPSMRSLAGLNTSPIAVTVKDHLRTTKKFLIESGMQSEIYYIDLPVGRAGLIESSMKTNSGLAMDIYTYIIHHGRTEYRFTFAEDAARGKQLQQLSRTIIKTMRFTS